MFNSVEFVLLFLSMFPYITEQRIKAVEFLLGLAFQYDTTDLRTMIICHGGYAAVVQMIEPLLALAQCSGYDIMDVDRNDLTEEDAYEILHSILEPILGRLDPQEMEQMRYTAMSGGEVLELPEHDLAILVKSWATNAREDERFGRPKPKDTDTNTEKQRRMPGPDEAVKDGPDSRPKKEKLGAWGRMKMDDKTAMAIITYCKGYTAAPVQTTLGRVGRVVKRKLGRRGAGNDEIRSISTESSRLCIGMSPSGRTVCFVRPKDEDEATTTRSDEYKHWNEDGSMDGHGTRNSNASYKTAKSDRVSISTFSIKLERSVQPPPLVGYYIRVEEHYTKHGRPSPTSTAPSTPPRSPIPGLTIEQVYEGYSNSWATEQNWLWKRALKDKKRQYKGVGMVEDEPEVKGQKKRGVVGTTRLALRRAIKLWKN